MLPADWLDRFALLPFLAANAEAFAKGLKRLAINVWGLPYALAPFTYQVKCLQQLRDKFSALDQNDRTALRPVLERTGCWEHLIGGLVLPSGCVWRAG